MNEDEDHAGTNKNSSWKQSYWSPIRPLNQLKLPTARKLQPLYVKRKAPTKPCELQGIYLGLNLSLSFYYYSCDVRDKRVTNAWQQAWQERITKMFKTENNLILLDLLERNKMCLKARIFTLNNNSIFSLQIVRRGRIRRQARVRRSGAGCLGYDR